MWRDEGRECRCVAREHVPYAAGRLLIGVMPIVELFVGVVCALTRLYEGRPGAIIVAHAGDTERDEADFEAACRVRWPSA